MDFRYKCFKAWVHKQNVTKGQSGTYGSFSAQLYKDLVMAGAYNNQKPNAWVGTEN